MVDGEVHRLIRAALPRLEEDVCRAAAVGRVTLLSFVRDLGGGEDPANEGLDAEVSSPHAVPVTRDRVVAKNVVGALAFRSGSAVVARWYNGESEVPTEDELEVVRRDGQTLRLSRRGRHPSARTSGGLRCQAGNVASLSERAQVQEGMICDMPRPPLLGQLGAGPGGDGPSAAHERRGSSSGGSTAWRLVSRAGSRLTRMARASSPPTVSGPNRANCSTAARRAAGASETAETRPQPPLVIGRHACFHARGVSGAPCNRLSVCACTLSTATAKCQVADG